MKVKEVSLCGNCETPYDDEYDARHCCQPSPRDAYQCGQCKKIFAEDENAKACCTKDAEGAEQCLYCPALLTPEDLRESAMIGSLKLCGEHRPSLEVRAA